MDFDLTAEQARLLDSLDDTIVATGGVERAHEVARKGGYDELLDTTLQERVDLTSASLLERLLVAEVLAERGAATTFGMRAVLGSAVDLPSGPVAVTDSVRRGPVRFGAHASTLVLLDGADAYLASLKQDSAEAVPSSYGYPYGQIDRAAVDRGNPLGSGDRLRALWRLATAAEIAGTAATAIALTAEHLRTRTQFGQPLAQFQALRHRLADAAVTAEATRWMAREAAFVGENRGFDLVASYAGAGAAGLVPELVQMCGARSFTIEFDLQVYAMRLAGLRLELGGEDTLATAVLAYTDSESGSCW